MAGDYNTATPVLPRWLPVALVLLAAALLPFDASLARAGAWANARLGGDPKRELEFLQQFGGLTSLILVAILIWRLDLKRLPRCADLGLAALFMWLICQTAKITAGRLRPKHGDPFAFIGPLRPYPAGRAQRPTHSWEVFTREASELWSMPSSHTASAVVLAAFLAVLYPRLRWLAVSFVLVVAAARWLLGAHYPSDIAAGAAAGLIAVSLAERTRWGSRLALWFWKPGCGVLLPRAWKDRWHAAQTPQHAPPPDSAGGSG